MSARQDASVIAQDLDEVEAALVFLVQSAAPGDAKVSRAARHALRHTDSIRHALACMRSFEFDEYEPAEEVQQ